MACDDMPHACTIATVDGRSAYQSMMVILTRPRLTEATVKG